MRVGMTRNQAREAIKVTDTPSNPGREVESLSGSISDDVMTGIKCSPATRTILHKLAKGLTGVDTYGGDAGAYADDLRACKQALGE